MNDCQVLYGKSISSAILEEVAENVARLKAKQVEPCLVTVTVGGDAASQVYLTSQMKSAEKLGITSRLANLPESATQAEVGNVIDQLNNDPMVHGIMLHVPLPDHLDSRALQWQIDSKKDVEGVTPYNVGRLMLGKPRLVPCTALSVVALIKSTGIKLRGKEAVMIGRSDIVGKPVCLMLTAMDCTVTTCHRATSEAGRLEEHARRADILIASVGSPHFVKGDWVKPGAIVIDVGINSVDNHTVGDVEYETAAARAGFITPVPGGVGTLTVAFLWKNLIDAVNWQLE